MLQLPTDLCFLDKSLNHLWSIFVFIQQHLDCQVSPQVGIATLQDRSPTATSDLTLQSSSTVTSDNEFGYSCQVHRILEKMAGIRYAVYPKERKAS